MLTRKKANIPVKPGTTHRKAVVGLAILGFTTGAGADRVVAGAESVAESSSSMECSQLRVSGFFPAAIGATNLITSDVSAPSISFPTPPVVPFASIFRSSDETPTLDSPFLRSNKSVIRRSSTRSSNCGPICMTSSASPRRKASTASSFEATLLMMNSGR